MSLAVFAQDKVEYKSHARYLAKLIRHDSKDALWRIERLLSRLEEGESLNTNSAAVQLTQARMELSETLRGIERLDQLLVVHSAQEG
jgi:hypothetical protein